MSERSNKFRLGLFVLVAALLLAILIVLFGDMPGIFKGQYSYNVRFNTAPGIEVGSVVRKSGIRIGEVSSYTLDQESGAVLVRIAVDRKYQLRKSDQASLGRGIVMGDSSINFIPAADIRAEDREVAPTGFVFEGKSSDLLQNLGQAAGNLVPASQAALDEFRDTAKKLNELVPEMKRTMQEAQVAATNIARVAETANNLISSNQDKVNNSLDSVNRAASRVADLLSPANTKRMENIILNAETASSEIVSLLSQENRQMAVAALKSARVALDNLAATLNEDNRKQINSMVKSLESIGTQSVATLRNIDGGVTEARTVVKDLNKTVNNLNEGVTDTRKLIGSTGKKVEEAVTDAGTAVKRLASSADKFDATLTQVSGFTKELGERGPAIMKNVEATTARAEQAMADFSIFSRTLTTGDGTLKKLVMDPTLYNSINEAAVSLGRSTARVDRILYDLSIFSDKVARHPELLGVSGAVAPSSGIKK